MGCSQHAHTDDRTGQNHCKACEEDERKLGRCKQGSEETSSPHVSGVRDRQPELTISGPVKTKVKPLDVKMSAGTAHSANEALPPIHDIGSMFGHMVSRVPTIVDVVKRLNGRKLRVATMCSGTESPLLALDMITKSMEEQYDVKLGIDHVFSCEIEPFKQAYIERNFRPPILFRDVTELGRSKAHTAYGSLVEVPGNVDVSETANCLGTAPDG